LTDTLPLTEETRARRKAQLRYTNTPTWAQSRKWAWFWEVWLSDMDPQHKLTAFALWGFANNDFGPVFPSIANVATLVGVSERRIKSHVKEIEKRGFADREIGGGRLSTRYQLGLPDDVLKLNLMAPRIANHTGDAHDTGDISDTRTMNTSSSYTEEEISALIISEPFQRVLKKMSKKSASAIPQKVSSEPAGTEEDDGHEEGPSIGYRRAQFGGLLLRVKRIDRNHLVSRYLWCDKGFEAFVKRVNRVGFDEFASMVCQVVSRENYRCIKDVNSIRTWDYFRDEMLDELGSKDDCLFASA
jgi:hypothetical protein